MASPKVVARARVQFEAEYAAFLRFFGPTLEQRLRDAPDDLVERAIEASKRRTQEYQEGPWLGE